MMKRLSVGVCIFLGVAVLAQPPSGAAPASPERRPENGPSDPSGGTVITNRSLVATPVPPQPEAADTKEIEPSALLTLQDWGLSETDARKAWKFSGVLFDLQETYRSHPDFGTTWNAVVEVFSLNVRLVRKNQEIEAAISGLSKQLGEPIVVHYGGMSYHEMESFKVDFLGKFAKQGISFRTDTQNSGKILVVTEDARLIGVIRDLGNANVKLSIGSSSVGTRLVGAASEPGAIFWQLLASPWGAQCSSGGSFRLPWAPHLETLMTAGHCPDTEGTNGYDDTVFPGSPLLNGVYSQRLTVCSPYGDYQFHDYHQVSPYISNLFSVRPTSSPTYYFNHEIAGGLNGGMLTYTVGYASRVFRGGIYASSFSQFDWRDPGAVVCGGPMYGPIFNRPGPNYPPAIEGDSGGPTFNLYNGKFYMAAINHSSNAPESSTQGTWVDWILGHHNKWLYCTFTSPCY